MKHFVRTIICILLLSLPVSAMSFTAPEVPNDAKSRMPDNMDSFSDALVDIVRKGIQSVRPDLKETGQMCAMLVSMVLILSVFHCFDAHMEAVGYLVGAVSISVLLMGSTGAMIQLAGETIQRLRDYGNLLFPVMAGSLAAQGGVTSSAGLYLGTAAFDSALGTLLSVLVVPAVHLYLIFAIAGAASADTTMNQLSDMIKGSIVWCLKTMLMVFTTYMSITGVISGTTDAAALKATKVTISTVVPVVGGILSEASEAVLLSAGIMKNAAGIYGIIAVLTLFLDPFLRIGMQYLSLKITNLLCGIFGDKRITGLIGNYSSAMGMLLGVIGSQCMLLMISTVCFMKGAAA